MRQNLVFSVNFSITGKGKENHLMSILILQGTQKPWTFLWSREAGNQECKQVGKLLQRETVSLETNHSLPRADAHVTSTGLDKMLPFPWLAVIPAPLPFHSTKIWNPVRLPFCIKSYLAKGWCATFYWAGEGGGFLQTFQWTLSRTLRAFEKALTRIQRCLWHQFHPVGTNVLTLGSAQTDSRIRCWRKAAKASRTGRYSVLLLRFLNMGCNPPPPEFLKIAFSPSCLPQNLNERD